MLSRLFQPSITTTRSIITRFVRQLSSVPPPPRRRFQVPQRENPKLRNHAVSIFHGDYSDDGTDDPLAEQDDDDQEDEDQANLARLIQQDEAKRVAKQKKWDSQIIEHATVIDERGRSYGRGGRKTATARVYIQPGMGEVVVNRKSFEDYFPRESHREDIIAPFIATRTCGYFDVQCFVEGGGNSGQAGAIRHGIARALNKYNSAEYRPALKRLGYLTRDPRKVERKKVGLVKARKAPQWVRR